MKNKTLKKIVIILIAILVIELIYFGIKYIKVRKESTYYSAINSTIKVNDKYVSVGLSDLNIVNLINIKHQVIIKQLYLFMIKI